MAISLSIYTYLSDAAWNLPSLRRGTILARSVRPLDHEFGSFIATQDSHSHQIIS